MSLGYEINLEELCHNQNFQPFQVVSSDLVFPKGAVPNARIIWIRVELTNGERKFVTKALADFYTYVDLPESSIGGWTEGDRGTDSMMDKRLDIVAGPQGEDDGSRRSDHAGHDAGDEDDDSGGGDEAPSEILDGAESTAATVGT